ncbi:MAG: AlpA family phage regulatory protein [Rhodanobacteraceae bacterium]|nr:MAG: AlpA family phage regulatory protein [Rhodanobacteraceae bacterium]
MVEPSALPSAGTNRARTCGGRFVDIDGLSEITGIAKATIYSDLCRAPWKLPQGYRLPGRRKILWDKEEVVDWIKRFPDRTLGSVASITAASAIPRRSSQAERQRMPKKRASAEPHDLHAIHVSPSANPGGGAT